MRTAAIAIIGLAALAHTLPTGDDVSSLEKRQYQIGEPSTTLTPGNAPSERKKPDGIWIAPSTPEEGPEEPEFTVGKRGGRDDSFWLPDPNLTDKQNIIRAELELQDLQNKLDSLKGHKRNSPEVSAIERKVEHIKNYLRKTSDITNIKAPPGTTTTFTPGKRSFDEAKVNDLEEAYIKLLSPYKGSSRSPPTATWGILKGLAELLKKNGRHVDTIVLGPAKTTFRPSSIKRQDKIGIGCSVPEVIANQAALFLLLQRENREVLWIIWEIRRMLAECNAPAPELPPWAVIPQPTIPGGPIVPDPTRPGSPIVPDPGRPGSPMVPDRPTPGAPLVPERPAPGAPMRPDRPSEGAPLVPSS